MSEVREYFCKRVLDFLVAWLLLLLCLPMMGLVALLVWWEVRAGVVVATEVAGRNGKPFRMFRFRTLEPGVDKVFKGDVIREDDPGTTRVGRFLLNAGLDGLPLLWNVLRGEMSFVGPAPDKLETAAYYSRRLPRYPQRHLVRPGVVSMADVYGSFDMPASHRLKYDLFYMGKMSFTWDARLLFVASWSFVRGRLGLEEAAEAAPEVPPQ